MANEITEWDAYATWRFQQEAADKRAALIREKNEKTRALMDAISCATVSPKRIEKASVGMDADGVMHCHYEGAKQLCDGIYERRHVATVEYGGASYPPAQAISAAAPSRAAAEWALGGAKQPDECVMVTCKDGINWTRVEPFASFAVSPIAAATGPTLGERIAMERAADAERARLMAALAEIKPPHRLRTHGDWARGWKEAGALEMWERVAALFGEEKKGDQ